MSAVIVGIVLGFVVIGIFEGGKAVGRSQRMQGQCDDHTKGFACYLCNTSKARKFPAKA